MSAIVSPSVQRKQSLVQKNPLTAFILLAFGLSWPFLIADALGSWGVIPFRLPLSGPGILITLFMAYTPTIAAFIVTGMASGRVGMRKLLGRILRWQAGIHWYLIVLLGIPLLYFIALQIYILLGGSGKPLAPGGLPMAAVGALVMFIVNGLVNGEEFAWRGFALPRLQAKYSALASSLILGSAWVLFHLPLFFTRGGGAGGNMSEMPFIAFVLIVLSGSVLATWLFNNTRGSVFFAYLFHAASNTWPGVFASASPGGMIFWIYAGLFSLAAVIVVIVYGPLHLSRTTMEDRKFFVEDEQG